MFQVEEFTEVVTETTERSTERSTEKSTVRPTLDSDTRLELRKLCWETMFGQELVKLTIMDLVSLIAVSIGKYHNHLIRDLRSLEV